MNKKKNLLSFLLHLNKFKKNTFFEVKKRRYYIFNKPYFANKS